MGAGNSNLEPDSCRTNCRNAFCGDGVKDSSEACDDGNANERDGCTWKCMISVCGNGIIESHEECDTGESNSNVTPNTCRTVCRRPSCGDAVMDANEECDDGNLAEEDGCNTKCALQCPEGSSKIQGRCIVLHTTEECNVLCQAGDTWDGFVTWLLGFFE